LARVWLQRGALAAALVFLVLTFINASWLAPAPAGSVTLIAHRGVHQQFNHAGVDDKSCTATRIEKPVHPFLENTIESVAAAKRLSAPVIQVDVAPTRDGKIVLFHDWTVDCRTNGKGETRSHTLAELKALDAGYGYSGDNGKSFPFRGKGVGAIPALEEVLPYVRDRALLFNFKSRDPAEADLLAAALKAAERPVEKLGDGFQGDPAIIARIRQHFPAAWAFDQSSIKACTTAYAWMGWLGITPSACRNGTLFVPLDQQWAIAGWPNRTQARMEAVGARIVVVASADKARPMGLDLPEQLGEIPSTYTGYIWTEDIWTIAPALFPRINPRNDLEESALFKALAARRSARQQ
jgi:glycerophosphoryl diester phosphodiesterase